jgi:hypothetical protein
MAVFCLSWPERGSAYLDCLAPSMNCTTCRLSPNLQSFSF